MHFCAPLRSLTLLFAVCLTAVLSLYAQPNYWQQRTTAVGFNVGINPLNPYTVYSERTSGVLSVSRDKGLTWSDLPASPGVSGIRHILVHPKDTLTIFVCEFFNLGLMKTTDEGATWRVVLANYGIDGESIDYDPVHPDTMYAGKFSDGAVYRSTDRGENWNLQGFSGANLCGLIVRPDSANILYAGTGASTISKSTDAGVTWRLVNNGGAEEVPKFAINPINPLIGYATTYGEPDSVNNLWKTIDGGETWFKTSLQKIGIWSIAIDAQHPETLYVGRFGDSRGIERTTDGGVTFQHYEGGLLNNFAAWNLRVHPLSPNDVWVAGTENLFGGGGIFQFVEAPAASISGTKFHDTNADGVRDSAEQGIAGWKIFLSGGAIDSALTDTGGHYSFPNLFGGSYTISEEAKGGWAQTFPVSGTYAISLSQGEDSSGLNFGNFALPKNAVVDGWNMISLPVVPFDERKTALFPSSVSSAFAFTKSYGTADTIFPGVGYWLKFPGTDTIVITGTPTIRDTIALRQGWNMIGSLSIPVRVNTITSIPGGIVTTQFFGYAGNYYVADSIAPGRSYWVKVNAEGRLILTGSGGGMNSQSLIWILPTIEHPPAVPTGPVSDKQPIPAAFALEQNYPNPFNPTSMIHYQLPVNSYVSLRVYSIVGELVVVLKDEIQDVGFKAVDWDAHNFASGVYYYILKTVSSVDPTVTFTQVRKMVLLK